MGTQFNYYEFFVRMIEKARSAAELLEKSLDKYNPDELKDNLAIMHEIEHSADLLRHEMMESLHKEFLPPIDRQDIADLADVLDNVIDSIEDVMQRMYMYNIIDCRPEAILFARIITTCCIELHEVLKLFEKYKKNKNELRDGIIKVSDLEEQADEIYIQATRALYTEAGSALIVSSWNEVFSRLESCCDACEDVADAVETVIMKNS